MKLLLDTNALIWWLEDNRKLGSRARGRLADPRTVSMVTIVSLWEMTMKFRAGKLKQPGSALLSRLAEQQVELLDLRVEHLCALDDIAQFHDDPFDHLILAQAKVEKATLLTSDDKMRAYGVPCMDTD